MIVRLRKEIMRDVFGFAFPSTAFSFFRNHHQVTPKPRILPVSSLLVREITQVYAAVLTDGPYLVGFSGANG
jgi:hypothetical protein